MNELNKEKVRIFCVPKEYEKFKLKLDTIEDAWAELFHHLILSGFDLNHIFNIIRLLEKKTIETKFSQIEIIDYIKKVSKLAIKCNVSIMELIELIK